jgi:quercetin dioxygenase-like cupin family protein
MSNKGYEVAHVDELEELPVNKGEFVWRPVRRRFGITAFGTNAYTGKAGQRVIEEHTEEGGHEELYVVLRGRATFTLDGDEIDAPAGTLVFARPGTKRGAIAAEDGTAVLGIGAKPGVVFEPSSWEDFFAAGAYADLGEWDKGRALMEAALAARPDDWRGHYNFACLLALNGDPEAAVAELQRAHELEPTEVAQYARKDPDFESIRDDPRYSAIAGEADAGGERT